MDANQTMVLFGAGASFGSEPSGISVPPLCNKLFDTLAEFSPDTWGALPDPYPRLFRDDFEAAFVKLGNDRPLPLSPGSDPTSRTPADLTGPLQRSMAEFFLEFVPTNNSLYYRLAQRIAGSQWTGVLASLNYDLLLPIALFRLQLMPSFVSRDGRELRLCLPHGSSALLVEPGRLLGNAVLTGLGNRITGLRAVFEFDKKEAKRRLKEEFAPPVMSFIEPSKAVVSCPEFLVAQRELLAVSIANARTIVVTGVAVREHDRHIWDHLRSTPARLVYCSPGSSAVEFERWANRARRGKSNVVLPLTFHEAFDQACGYIQV